MVSILLATFNGERYIRQSIDSILNQTFNQWELLIGFNGTTDSSINIVQEYNDERIRVFNFGDDKGKAKTLNKLIIESSYNWCSIQDDDDIWLPDKLSEQFSISQDYDIIGTFIEYINANGVVTGGVDLATDHDTILQKTITGNNQIANSSAIFRKSAAKEIGFWREDIDGIEDIDFWIRLLKAGYYFYNLPVILVQHRLHPASNYNTKAHNLNRLLQQYK